MHIVSQFVHCSREDHLNEAYRFTDILNRPFEKDYYYLRRGAIYVNKHPLMQTQLEVWTIGRLHLETVPS